MSDTRTFRLLFCLLMVALVLRLACLPIGLRMAEHRGIDFYDEYGTIARNIADGKGFSYAWVGPERPTSIHSPLYPYLLSAVFRVLGTGMEAAIAMIGFNLMVSLALVYAVYRFLLRLWGAWPALVGAAVMACYPPQIYYSVSGLPTVLYALLFFLVLFTAWRVYEQPSRGRAGVWGLMIGICALSYSFVLVLAPLLVFWLLIAGRDRFRQMVIASMIAAGIAMLVCTPWTLRNYEVHQRWILIRDQAGINLWWGNNELATGSMRDQSGKILANFPPEIEEAMRRFDNEVDADRFVGQLVVEQMKANPERTLRLWGKKLYFFWWQAPEGRAGGAGINWLLPVLLACKAVFLSFAFWGLYLLYRQHRALFGLVTTTAVTLSMVHMVFHSGNFRYFFPLEAVLALPIALALSMLLATQWPSFHPDATLPK